METRCHLHDKVPCNSSLLSNKFPFYFLAKLWETFLLFSISRYNRWLAHACFAKWSGISTALLWSLVACLQHWDAKYHSWTESKYERFGAMHSIREPPVWKSCSQCVNIFTFHIGILVQRSENKVFPLFGDMKPQWRYYCKSRERRFRQLPWPNFQNSPTFIRKINELWVLLIF